MFVGGRQIRIASVLRFCTMAARWNSSRAPERDHEFRVDRRPADLAVEGLQLLPNVGQYPRNRRIDAAHKMARRNATLEG
jgi:hypothetical protein